MAQLLLGMTGGDAVVPSCQAPRGNGTTGVAPLAGAGHKHLGIVLNDPRPVVFLSLGPPRSVALGGLAQPKGMQPRRQGGNDEA